MGLADRGGECWGGGGGGGPLNIGPLHGVETRQRAKTSTIANAPLSKPCVNFTGML